MRPWSCVIVTKFCPGGSSRLNWIPKYQSPLVSKKDFEAARVAQVYVFDFLLCLGAACSVCCWNHSKKAALDPNYLLLNSHHIEQVNKVGNTRFGAEGKQPQLAHHIGDTQHSCLKNPRPLEMTQDKMRNLEKELATNFHQHRRSITLNQASRPLRRRVKLEVLKKAADASASSSFWSSFWSSWACEFKGLHPWKLT